MLKICHIISGDLFAGAESVVLQLLQNFKSEEKVTQHVLLFNDGILAEKLKDIEIPFCIIDENQLSFSKMIALCRNYIKQINAEIIHSHNYKENIISTLATRNLKVKRIATQHGLSEKYSGLTSLKNQALLKLNLFILSHFFKQLVLVSEELRSTFYEKFKFPSEKIRIIHNGVDLPADFDKSKKEKQLIIGSAGRFVPIKDYSFYLKVAQYIKSKSEKTTFVLIGEGPGKNELLKLREQLGLNDCFKILKFESDLDNFYKNIDLYINTSLHEGIPVTVLEAMSYGVPVIAPKVGGLKEIITNGVDGFLVKNRDPKEFGECCLALINDEKMLDKMCSESYSTIQTRFSSEQMKLNYLKAYNDIA